MVCSFQNWTNNQKANYLVAVWYKRRIIYNSYVFYEALKKGLRHSQNYKSRHLQAPCNLRNGIWGPKLISALIKFCISFWWIGFGTFIPRLPVNSIFDLIIALLNSFSKQKVPRCFASRAWLLCNTKWPYTRTPCRSAEHIGKLWKASFATKSNFMLIIILLRGHYSESGSKKC